jgi:hypothetical protein
MYKGVSQGLQKAASTLSLAELQSGAHIELSESEKRGAEHEHLKSLVRNLEGQIIALPKSSKRRKELGREKLALQEKLRVIREHARNEDAALRVDNKLEKYFVKAAFRLLSRYDFGRIMQAAENALVQGKDDSCS